MLFSKSRIIEDTSEDKGLHKLGDKVWDNRKTLESRIKALRVLLNARDYVYSIDSKDELEARIDVMKSNLEDDIKRYMKSQETYNDYLEETKRYRVNTSQWQKCTLHESNMDCLLHYIEEVK